MKASAILLALSLTFALPAVAADCTIEVELEHQKIFSDRQSELVLRGVCNASDVPLDARVRVSGSIVTIDLPRPDAGITVPSPWGERVLLPPLAEGSYTLVVRSRGEEWLRRPLRVYARPFELTPDFGNAGTEVIIEGVDLSKCQGPLACPQPQVYFGTTPSPDVRVTARGELTAVVPRGSGTVDVVVLNPSLEELRFAEGFRYTTYNDPETDYDHVLFPIDYAGRGAHGSDWRTDITIRNDAPVAVFTVPLFWSDPQSPVLPPLQSIIPGARGSFGGQNRDGGAYLWVPEGLEERLTYASHIIDRSRAATNRGTEIPVVRADDTDNEIRLIEVPVREAYRAKLRVYDFDPDGGREVFMSVRNSATGEPLYSERLTLTPALLCAAMPPARCFSLSPPFATRDIFTTLSSVDRVDITLRSRTNEGRIWAFVSVTNNETQHVTLFTPQHATGAD